MIDFWDRIILSLKRFFIFFEKLEDDVVYYLFFGKKGKGGKG